MKTVSDITLVAEAAAPLEPLSLSGKCAELALDQRTASSSKKAIQDLLWALPLPTDPRASIPLPYAIAFLMVALDQGQGVCAYARALGISRSAMSRYLRDIGDRARNGGAGMGLVTLTPHPTDLRRRKVVLTPKGRSVARDVVLPMRRAHAG